jgi:hypothetical protein
MPPTPPTVAITSGPPELTNDPTATITFTVDPAGGRVTCVLNAQPLEPCESGRPVTAREGANTFEVRGVDAQGDEGGPATYSWTLDTMPPTVTFTSIDLVYGSKTSASECWLDAEPVSCAEPISGLSGSHTFQASVGTGLTWALEATPPGDVAFVVDPTLESFGTSRIRLAFTTSEGATVSCSSDGAEIPCDGMLLVDELSAGEGETASATVRVVATDGAGNSGDAALTWSFSVATSVD